MRPAWQPDRMSAKPAPLIPTKVGIQLVLRLPYELETAFGAGISSTFPLIPAKAGNQIRTRRPL